MVAPGTPHAYLGHAGVVLGKGIRKEEAAMPLSGIKEWAEGLGGRAVVVGDGRLWSCRSWARRGRRRVPQKKRRPGVMIAPTTRRAWRCLLAQLLRDV